MNTYSKLCPHVFLAKCTEKQEKGSTILVTTRHGKENESIVYNLVYEKESFFFYSIVRADGFNAQERAKSKAEKLRGYASNSNKRSQEYFEKSDLRESKSGIPFGQPILVGHHSERKHRKTIERATKAFDKAIEEDKKTEEYNSRAEYWESKENEINLSMPESIEFYQFKYEIAKKHHQELKDDATKRRHGYSLTYAKKEVNQLEKKLKIAKQLWS